MEKLKELEQQLQNLQAEIEKLKQAEQVNQWVPGFDEVYWFIKGSGEIGHTYWRDDPYDKLRISIGNVYRTKEEAEFEVERLKVIAELKEYAGEFVVGGENYFISYNYDDKQIDIEWDDFYKYPLLYFPSEEIAKKAVAEVGEDRVKKYYLEVE